MSLLAARGQCFLSVNEFIEYYESSLQKIRNPFEVRPPRFDLAGAVGETVPPRFGGGTEPAVSAADLWQQRKEQSQLRQKQEEEARKRFVNEMSLQAEGEVRQSHLDHDLNSAFPQQPLIAPQHNLGAPSLKDPSVDADIELLEMWHRYQQQEQLLAPGLFGHAQERQEALAQPLDTEPGVQAEGEQLPPQSPASNFIMQTQQKIRMQQLLAMQQAQQRARMGQAPGQLANTPPTWQDDILSHPEVRALVDAASDPRSRQPQRADLVPHAQKHD